MSYLGKIQFKSSDVQRFDVTSSTSATHVLSWTAPNEQSLIITINGVKQQDDAYSIAGSPTTVTLTDALVSTDKLEIVGIVDVGTMNVPGVGSVQTDQLADDVVTADKLANSINTEIAANTAKVTNATHTGDVTGATALTIAADAVDIAMLSATGTASASTFLRGDNAWAAPAGGGITHASAWRLTVTFTGGVDPIASNLEVNDTSGYASLGAAMTESSGIFTFPTTGFWLIKAWGSLYLGSGNSRYVQIQIKTTIDADTGPTWVETGGVMQMVPDSASAHYAAVSNEYIFDVTNTTTHKVSFRAGMEGSSVQFIGSSTADQTYFQFIRLADT